MKTSCTLLASVLIIVDLTVTVHSQSIQSRHYRPLPDKCDRYGRCSPKEGFIEEVDDDDNYKSTKERPILTRDDRPVRPLSDDYDHKKDEGKDDVLKPGGIRPSGGGYGGTYNPKPPIDKDDEIKVNGGRSVGGYNPKPSSGTDDDLRPSIGRRPEVPESYKPKPVIDKDDSLKPVVTRPVSGGSEGYIPKPAVDKDDDLKPIVSRPSAGGGGYGGGNYKPKPVDDRDNDRKPVIRPSSSGDSYGSEGYKPKPSDDQDYDIKPAISRPSSGYGGGSYRPKADEDRDGDIKPTVIRPVRRDDYDTDGYKPKPTVNRDDDLKPAIETPSSGGGRYRGGYNLGGNRGRPRIKDEDYDSRPIRGGGGYYPSEGKYNKDDLGGYNGPKDDDYNDYDEGKYEDYDDKPVPVVDGNCICVPYYQCTDGHIVTDGAGIIDARKRPDPDDELPLDGKFKPPSCGPYHVCCNTPESSTVKPYEHRCGVRNPSGINSRILSPSNKGEADFGEWPWQAAVLKSEGKVNIFQCGGVLIDKYHVLTVAHCVFHLYQLNEYPLKVRLGEWDTQTTTEFLAHEDYKVSKIIIHPEYRNTSLWNDIAVLRLQDPVLFAPHIDTVCLPQYDEMFSGQNCVVTGWGKDAYKGGTFSNVMKEVALQVIDNYKCEEMLRKTRLGRFFQLHEGFLCAGGEYGLDSCKGDGGGPLVCYRKDKSYALAGIVSWGIDCGQPGVPGVYVKIQKYLDWISKTTGVTLQEYWPKH